jgi:uncharacterized protein YydD (DUF2326 family)
MSIRDDVSKIAKDIRPNINQQLKETGEAVVSFAEIAKHEGVAVEDMQTLIELIAKELNLTIIEKTDSSARLK